MFLLYKDNFIVAVLAGLLCPTNPNTPRQTTADDNLRPTLELMIIIMIVISDRVISDQ